MATLLCGGLAGSVFTYWVNRPKATVVSYSLSSATIADAESGSVIPGCSFSLMVVSLPLGVGCLESGVECGRRW